MLYERKWNYKQLTFTLPVWGGLAKAASIRVAATTWLGTYISCYVVPWTCKLFPIGFYLLSSIWNIIFCLQFLSYFVLNKSTHQSIACLSCESNSAGVDSPKFYSPTDKAFDLSDLTETTNQLPIGDTACSPYNCSLRTIDTFCHQSQAGNKLGCNVPLTPTDGDWNALNVIIHWFKFT